MSMKTVLKKYLNWYRWKMQNKWKNSTSLFINGDLNKVEVGRYTYGRLNVFCYGNESEKLQIGSFCNLYWVGNMVLPPF